MNIFYSWESDIPKQKNEIEKAIKIALKKLKKEDNCILNLDRDTKNISGAINIVDTILSKINNSSIFISDISFIDKYKHVNQNVLLELGYALKKLGTNRIIMIFNNHFGHVEELPFDIRQLRILSFNEFPELANDLYNGLKLIYQNNDFKDIYDDCDQRDIDTFYRIISDIPRNLHDYFIKVYNMRGYRNKEGEFIFELPFKINDVNNYIINDDLRTKILGLKKSFEELSIVLGKNCFALEDKFDTRIMIRPEDNNTKALDRYYEIIETDLKNALNNAEKSYTELCTLMITKFGIEIK